MTASEARIALLAWYEPRRRRYPWRVVRPDAYRTLVSEVMLQQTQAVRVVPAFRGFLRRFPSVQALASASLAEALRAWGSLGYNRRAATLHRAARAIVGGHGGVVPGDVEALRTLPGVGPYTAAAVASIAFGVAVAAVDTNVARVVTRFHLGREPATVPASTVALSAQAWLDPVDPGRWNQAVMDLGRDVCRPAPRCDRCPLSSGCRSRGAVDRAVRRRPAAPYRGSTREARGGVMRVLRSRPDATISDLVTGTGWSAERIAGAVRSLSAEGLVVASPGALSGRARGRVSLPA